MPIQQPEGNIVPIAAILTIFGAIVAAGLGAYLGVYMQNVNKQQTTAQLVYDDIDNLNWTLHNLSQMIIENPDTVPYIITPIYDNGLYYSYRSDIASLDTNVSRNISIFYTDMQYAENYRKVIKAAIEDENTKNSSQQISLSYDQYKNAILDANDLRPQILNEMEISYNIPKNHIKNRFNQY
jgi:hypothetical protein